MRSSAAFISFCGKAVAAHGQHELLAQRLALRERQKLLLAHRREARQEGEVEGRHPHRRGRHLVDEAHQRAHLRARDRRARREAPGSGDDLVEIFDDDGGIDDDVAVVIERRHDAIGIEREIVGLELVAGKQVELFSSNGSSLALSTKRTRWLQVDCGAL